MATEGRSAYVARLRLDPGRPAHEVGRHGGEPPVLVGLQAIVTTTQNILLGDCDLGVCTVVAVIETKLLLRRPWALARR